MHTLYDFLTYVKGVEYLLAVAFIGLYLLYWEALKPKPFRTLAHSGKEEMAHIRQTGYGNTLRTVGKVAAAPFIGLAYIVMLPFSFAIALAMAVGSALSKLAGPSVSFGWRPVEAYLAGKNKKKRKKEQKKETETGGKA
jgi:hypothetical protein